MTAISGALRRNSSRLVEGAVRQSRTLSPEGLRERLFTLTFQGMVYPQIWEDPEVDLEALEITPECHVVAIASGGCNVLSYLTADPARITALDLNAAHIALNKLKLRALEELGEHGLFHRFFGQADDRANVALYDERLKPRLDRATRAYWEGRDLMGRRRITRFARGFYRFGLLGRFIGAGHLAARLFGVRLAALLEARDLEEQRLIFETAIAPLFDRRAVRWLADRPASLYGLGIPPAQYRALAGKEPGGMAAVLCSRLHRLACGADLRDNYFAWQAFGRAYPPLGGGRLPPYLEPVNFQAIKARAGRVEHHLMSITEFLRGQAARSLDRYVLLDAQDWMGPAALNELWREITRTAQPGARVIFRTAAEADLLPGRVSPETLRHWAYQSARSAELAARDRSAIYGGFHLYVAAERRP